MESRFAGYLPILCTVLAFFVTAAVITKMPETLAGDPPPVPLPKPGPADIETAWSTYLAARLGVDPEYRLPDGSRADIVTDTHVYEVEWCNKWEESIGQVMYYHMATDKPGVVYLLKRPGDDEDYIRCLAVVRYLAAHDVPISLEVEEVPSKPKPVTQ